MKTPQILEKMRKPRGKAECRYCKETVSVNNVNKYHNENCPTVTHCAVVGEAKGKKWFTNGETDIMSHPDEIPCGFHLGRTIRKRSPGKWFNNGIINRCFKNGTPIPSDFTLGRLRGK